MERKDLELEQRVWQRVNGCKPGREEASLRELEQRCRESAQVFRQLAQGCSGPLREGLAELHRQEHANALTIRGIRILSGEEPEAPSCCPWSKTGTCRALALAFRRSREALEDYTRRSSAGEYAPVFAGLARREGEKQCRLLALIGLCKGG